MIAKLAWRNIWFKPLNTLLSIVLLSSSVAIITVLILLQKQFEEKKQDGVKYVNLQGGLICPKENANNLIKSFDEIYTNAIKEQVQEFGAKRIISYEYFNHETQISGDIEQIKAVLSQYVSLFPNQFTEELINTTCNECFQYAIENDCF